MYSSDDGRLSAPPPVERRSLAPGGLRLLARFGQFPLSAATRFPLVAGRKKLANRMHFLCRLTSSSTFSSQLIGRQSLPSPNCTRPPPSRPPPASWRP